MENSFSMLLIQHREDDRRGLMKLVRVTVILQKNKSEKNENEGEISRDSKLRDSITCIDNF